MNINVALNPKSIQEAKNRLLSIKTKLQNGEIMKAFFQDCSEFLLSKMEATLLSSGIGSNVVSDILSSWTITITENKLLMVNSSDKAVFVEFGVGIVGYVQQHPKADVEGYEYDVPSEAKDSNGAWHFFSNEADLDIPQDAIDYGGYGSGSRNRMSIYTRGTKGVWYAYNAIQDLRLNIRVIWNNVKKRIIG